MENRKIAFLGNGDFAKHILEELKDLNLIILNNHQEIKEVNPDLVVVASYGKIIPKSFLDLPRYGCLNVHPSLLPKYRGASPIQNTILNNEKEAGVSIILMDEKMDHGPIVASIKYQISEKIRYKELEKELAKLSAKLLKEVLPKWLKGKVKPKEQEHSQATFTKVLKREDGEVNLDDDPREIERKVRAFDPWPGIYAIWKNKRIKILDVKVLDNKLMIKKVQPEGKKEMSFEDFKRGHQEFPC